MISKLPEPTKTKLVLTDDILLTQASKGIFWQLRDALGHLNPWNISGGAWQVVIPKGTVFLVGSYSVTTGWYSNMNLKVIQSPELRFLPKRRGGTGRPCHIRPQISELRKWPLEEYNAA